METPSTDGKEQENLRIVITSDTHDGAYFKKHQEKLVELSGDINLSIGDAFGSVIRDDLVGEYKKDNAGAIKALDEAERSLFDDMVSQGVMPIRAYWVSRVKAHPELLEQIKVELDTNYNIFAENFGTLQNSQLIFGNVEEGYKSSADFKEAAFNNPPDQVEQVQAPKLLFETETSIGVAFPSMKRNEKTTSEVESFISSIQEKIVANPKLKSIVFIAHENLFKGPTPEHFHASMKEAGEHKYFVPFFMPNEFRKEILNFIFTMPESIKFSFFYGHLHDDKEVTQKGFALADSEDCLGLQWGINKVDSNTKERRTRHFDMYQLPFQTVHTIDIGEEGDVSINKAI